MKGIDSHDEYWFRLWYNKWAQRTHKNYDPDSKEHEYNYREIMSMKIESHDDKL